MPSVIIGSRAWCDQWARFYADRAEKWLTRPVPPGLSEEYVMEHVMCDLFHSYAWRDWPAWAENAREQLARLKP